MATIKDKATGTLFPATFTAPGLSKSLTALGAGVREKKIVLVNVHIYAVACHVEAGPAKEALASFSGKAKLEKDDSFFSAIQGGSYETVFSLCFARDISHDQFSNGIKDSLEPLLKAKSAPADVLKSFVDSLSGLSYSTGSRLYLALSSDKVFVSGVAKADVPADLSAPAGLAVKEVASSDLVSALKEVYFGKHSVSESLKHNVADGLAAFLK